MSGLEILSTLNILIKLRLEIKTRLDSLNQATEDLQLLTTNLILLLKVFENPVDEDIVKIHVPEFANILDVLQSITHSCTKCAKALDIDLAGTTIATKKRRMAKDLSSGYGPLTRFLVFSLKFNPRPDGFNRYTAQCLLQFSTTSGCTRTDEWEGNC